MSKTVNYPHLLSRVCNAPLAIEHRRLQPLLAFLGPRIGVDFHVPMEALSGESQKPARNFTKIPENIGVVDVAGPLVRRASGLDALCGMTSYEQIENDFMESITDPSKQAVLMLLDSPGGEVGGLFDLADLIYGQRGQKPIYAAVSEAAFSAAYALASACDQIFLTRTAGVGSIGVFTMHLDQSGFDKKEGVAFTYIFAGSKKVDGNPHEPLSTEAKDTIQSEVDRTYDLFAKTVARNRGLDARRVKNTEAGLFFGEDGVKNGLADEVGTVSEAIAAIQARLDKQAASSAPPRQADSIKSLPAAEAANLIKEKDDMKKIEDVASVQTTAADSEKECDEEATKGTKPKATDAPDDKKKPTDDDPEEDAKAKAADAKEVIFLCRVAKRPELAADLIDANLTLAEVRSKLLNAQVEEQRAPGAIGHHVSLTGANPTDQLDSMAKARAATTGKSYSAAYAEVMRENPKLYTQYLDSKDAAMSAKR